MKNNQRPKNALILSTIFVREEKDSIAPFTLDYAKGLLNIFDKVDVLVPHSENNKEKSKENIEGINIERFTYFFRNSWQFLCYRKGIPQNLKNHTLAWIQIPFLFITYISKALKYGKKSNFIYCNWTPTILIGLVLKFFYKSKVIAIAHGSDIRRIPKFINKFLLKRCDFIISGHEDLIEFIKKYELNTPTLKIRNFIDESKFKDAKPTTNKKKILWIGRLSEFKDPIFYLKIAKEFQKIDPSITFQLVGDGELREKVQNYIKDNKLKNINYLGARGDVPELINKCSAVFFSETINVIWGTVLIESILSKRVCIINDAGENCDFFDHNRNCILYKSNDKEDCINKMKKTFEKNFNSQPIVAAALETIRKEKFDQRSIIEQHLKIINQ